MNGKSTIRNLILVSAIALMAAGCSEDAPLPGLRETLRSPNYDPADPVASAEALERAMEPEFTSTSQPINVGAAQTLAAWTHRGGNSAHNPPNASLSAQPVVTWAANIGKGNNRESRITAEPVAADGRIFAMDAHATLTAVSTSGAVLWSVDLTTPGERAGTGTGGGLALGDGKIFATTTLGEVIALDPATGAIQWRQRVTGAARGAPTVSGGKVFVTTGASNAYAIETATGKIAWTLDGLVSQSGVSGVAAPAINGNTVLIPLANGALIGVDIGSGEAKWVARVSGGIPGAALSVEQDFTGEPVVSGGRIYAATPAGRTVAITGEGQIAWSNVEGAQGMMTAAGGALFFVNNEAQLVRISAADGSKVWSVDLPRYVKDKPKKIKSIFPAYGPVLAGGKIWIASGDGVLRGFDPASGTLVSAVELPAAAAARPIAVGGALYVVTAKGQLVALR